MKEQRAWAPVHKTDGWIFPSGIRRTRAESKEVLLWDIPESEHKIILKYWRIGRVIVRVEE